MIACGFGTHSPSAILAKLASTEPSGKTLVRPFKIRGNVVLQAGYTINYEMLLRNLSSDCRYIATVDVVSAHWVLMVLPSYYV